MSYQLWISPHTGYRRRGTSFAELSGMLERGLVASSISEPLRCCAANDPALEVRAELERLDFDVAGVMDAEGRVVGWVQRTSLIDETCGKHVVVFEPHQLISDSTPLIEIIRVLSGHERVYVVVRRGVSGIITRADLRKPPVRLLLFGLVSLLEMHLTYWTHELFPNDSWKEHLTETRRTKVAELRAARKLRNEEISEIDCLQLCDKRDILVQSNPARTTLGLGSKTKAAITLKSIEYVRDRLAHSQDDFTGEGGWPELAATLVEIERILGASESALEARIAASTMTPPRLGPAV
jgi:hypothetical protein